jgi:competence protein ComFC
MHAGSITRGARRFCPVLLKTAVDFIYPPLCIACHNPLPVNGDWLCRSCEDRLRENHDRRDACPRCSINRTVHTCACDLAWDFRFDTIFSLFDFDETIRAIAHEFKYGGKSRLAYYAGHAFASLVPPAMFDSIDAAVPMPLHYLRRMKRGYNQAEHFARGVIEGSGRDIPLLKNAVRRRRHTRTQTKLNQIERRANIRGAFMVPAKNACLISGKNILLFDDIVTTGATTDECAGVLMDNGAKSVRVISLARD